MDNKPKAARVKSRLVWIFILRVTTQKERDDKKVLLVLSPPPPFFWIFMGSWGAEGAQILHSHGFAWLKKRIKVAVWRRWLIVHENKFECVIATSVSPTPRFPCVNSRRAVRVAYAREGFFSFFFFSHTCSRSHFPRNNNEARPTLDCFLAGAVLERNWQLFQKCGVFETSSFQKFFSEMRAWREGKKNFFLRIWVGNYGTRFRTRREF